jgi:hypothetical protein
VTHSNIPEAAAKAGVAEKWRISAFRSLSRKIFPTLVVHPHKSPLGDNSTVFAQIMAFSLSKSTDKKRQINRRQVGQTGYNYDFCVKGMGLGSGTALSIHHYITKSFHFQRFRLKIDPSICLPSVNKARWCSMFGIVSNLRFPLPIEPIRRFKSHCTHALLFDHDSGTLRER